MIAPPFTVATEDAMNPQDISRYQDIFITTATDIGLKILAAIAFWVIGRWLINFAVRLVRTSLERQKVDPAIIEAFREAAKALIEARKEKVPASA